MKKLDSKGIDRLPTGTKLFTIICLAWALIVSLVPIVWLVLSSLKEDPLARPGFMLPESIHLEGYISTFRDLNVMQYFGNSMFISLVSVVISVVTITTIILVVTRALAFDWLAVLASSAHQVSILLILFSLMLL